MAEIRLTAGDDLYVQAAANAALREDIYGEDGNDTIRIYYGTVVGGRGNDRIELIFDPANPWRSISVAYWDSPTGVEVNLVEGWANDGFGGRDTLVGVSSVHGNRGDDRFIGDDTNNVLAANHGHDYFDGGGGYDSAHTWFNPEGESGGRIARLDELVIRVSVDGMTAKVTTKVGTGFSLDLVNVEALNVFDATGQRVDVLLANFITPQVMAEDAIAAGNAMRWNAAQPLGTAAALTFSFVTHGTQAGFRAFTHAEQQAARNILAHTTQLCGLQFTEVLESGGTTGQLRFGISQQAATKGNAALPGTQGDLAGDVWMDVESMLKVVAGSEGYAALLHEIGHALGLRHPRNTDPGESWAMQLREADDRPGLTAMSSQTSADGLFRADWGLLDVIALRYLYGERDVNVGDDRYVLDAAAGSAAYTLVDDGGYDTIDASQVASGVSIDLAPGGLGSAGITSAGFLGVENYGIAWDTWIEAVVGSAHDDVLIGNELDNTLTGSSGNDWIDGGAGTDTAAFEGRRADYEVSNQFGKMFVKARDGVSGFDTLTSIERLQFSDQTVVLSPNVLGNDSQLSVDEDAGLAATLPDPMDVARAGVSYHLAGAAAHGNATLSAAGQLQYTPAPNYHGIDTVAYDIVGSGGSNRYLVFVSVLPVNDAAPVSRGGGYLALGNNVLQGRLPAGSDIDGDTITYSLATEPRIGDMALASDGSFVYTARGISRGDDPFSFTVSDGMGGSNTYNARVLVASVVQTNNGTEGADTLGLRVAGDGYRGLGGRDRITGGAGNDAIDGGDDMDTAVYSGSRGGYRLTRTDYGWDVDHTSGTDGSDKLSNMERLQFTDISVALDLSGNAGTVAKILGAVFGKAEVTNELYAGIGLYCIDGGMSYENLMQLAIDARLGADASHQAIVDLLYTNVVGVHPPAGDAAHFVSLLDSQTFTVAGLGVMAADTDVNQANVDLVGLAQQGLEYVPYVGG